MTTLKTEIIIHCTDTHASWMKDKTGQQKVDEIRRWHVEERGWSDIGYNHVIDVDGSVIGGRDRDNDGDFAEETGAHAKGYNTQSIGVSLVGGHGSSADGEFSDNFTQAQGNALRGYIEDMERRFGPMYPRKAFPCACVKLSENSPSAELP